MFADKLRQQGQQADSDSGLSMPSGTHRLPSSLRFPDSPGKVSSRISDEEHDRLIRSLLRQSGEWDGSFSYLNASPSKGRALHSESLPPSQRSPSPQRMSALAPENYFSAGLRNSLSDTESRSNVLLEKLKEAQDTLRMQSVRLTKMEADYHSANYEVEEKRASESKLLKRLSEAEKQMEDLKQTRMRDLDVQINLQDRIKELEATIHNIIADFQLLEADQARRRELVEQLTTTIELVEEENHKLRKIESNLSAELLCLKQECFSGREECFSLKNQLEAQKQEARHWREETEKQQQALRLSQENISELRIKVASLTHKLENMEGKDRQLQKENEELRSKDHGTQDVLTDLRSKAAILSADKERLYQEKADACKDLEQLSLQHKLLQQEAQGLKRDSIQQTHDLQVKDHMIHQLTDTNNCFKEELSAAEKVGEKLSLELTKTKKLLETRTEEWLAAAASQRQQEEALTRVRAESEELRSNLASAQKEHEMLTSECAQEKSLLIKNLENSKSQLRDALNEKAMLQEQIVSCQSKVQALEQSSRIQSDDLRVQAESWKQMLESMKDSMERKEEEVAMLAQKLRDDDTQLARLTMELEATAIDYNRYAALQDEAQQLSLANRRLTNEKLEAEQVVQLLHTQRDIYARSVQEYTVKLAQQEKTIENTRQLEDQLHYARESASLMQKELDNIRLSKAQLETELNNAHGQLSSQKASLEHKLQVVHTERDSYRDMVDRVTQENCALQITANEKEHLESRIVELTSQLERCLKDKEIITSQSKQIDEFGNQISELVASLACAKGENGNLQHQLAVSKGSENELQRELSTLTERMQQTDKKIHALNKMCEEKENLLAERGIQNAEISQEISQLKVKLKLSESEVAGLVSSLQSKSGLEQTISELQASKQVITRSHEVLKSEHETLTTRFEKLTFDLQSAQDNLSESRSQSRLMSSEIESLTREKQQLKLESDKLQNRLTDVQSSSAEQVTKLTELLNEADDSKFNLQRKLDQIERELSNTRGVNQKQESQITERMQLIESMEASISQLRAELDESSYIQVRQEEVISSLKDENNLLRECDKELKEACKRIKDLQAACEAKEGDLRLLQQEALEKDSLEKQLHDISMNLHHVRMELQKTYAALAQKDMEIESLHKELLKSTSEAERNEEKVQDIKIRLEQVENAREVASATLQERIHELEAENQMYKSQLLSKAQQLTETAAQLQSVSLRVNSSRDDSYLGQDSLISLRTTNEHLQKECDSLKDTVIRLQAEQGHLVAEKRQAQTDKRQIQADMFKLEKEKEKLARSNTNLENSLQESTTLLKLATRQYEECCQKLVEAEKAKDKLQKDYTETKDEMNEIANQYQGELEKHHSLLSSLQVQLQDHKGKLAEFEQDCPSPSDRRLISPNTASVSSITGQETIAEQIERVQSTFEYPLKDSQRPTSNEIFESDSSGRETLNHQMIDSPRTSEGTDSGITRDVTLKIVKQLKKAKQRQKKCLAPSPKINESLEMEDSKIRRDSFENVETLDSDSDASDPRHLKEDIIVKSGKVEWRGDPREPHRQFASSCDLSAISDAEETDSLDLSGAFKHPVASGTSTGLQDSLQTAHNAWDSPQLDSRKKPQTGHQLEPHIPTIKISCKEQDLTDNNECIDSLEKAQIEKVMQSGHKVSKFAQQFSPDSLVTGNNDNDMNHPEPTSPSRIPKFSHNASKPQATTGNRPNMENSSRLPKLSLFKKAK